MRSVPKEAGRAPGHFRGLPLLLWTSGKCLGHLACFCAQIPDKKQFKGGSDHFSPRCKEILSSITVGQSWQQEVTDHIAPLARRQEEINTDASPPCFFLFPRIAAHGVVLPIGGVGLHTA